MKTGVRVPCVRLQPESCAPCSITATPPTPTSLSAKLSASLENGRAIRRMTIHSPKYISTVFFPKTATDLPSFQKMLSRRTTILPCSSQRAKLTRRRPLPATQCGICGSSGISTVTRTSLRASSPNTHGSWTRTQKSGLMRIKERQL